MGMDVNLDLDATLVVRIDAAIARALIPAGEVVLEASNLLAPVEEGAPRHGIHMVETGFVAPETGDPNLPRVRIGYGAYWAPWQHERLDYHHEHGQAKFLETALLAEAEAAVALAAEKIRAELGL